MASEAKMKSSMNIIKAVIKGLIISNPHQMTVYELMEDYKRSEGCALPYESYGFKSAEEFLKSLPDVVELYGHGVTAVVRPVTNEKTKHIQELVKQQKHDKPKRFPQEKTLAAANNINNHTQRSHGHGMTRNHNRQPQNRQQQAHGKQNNHATRNQQAAKNIKHFYKAENNPNNRQFGKNMTNLNESHVRKSVSESSKSVCSNNSGRDDVPTIRVQNNLSKSFATQHNDRQNNQSNSHSNSFSKQLDYKTHNLSDDRRSSHSNSHSNSFTKQRENKNNDRQNSHSNSFSKQRVHQHDDHLDLDFQLSHLAPRHLQPKNPIPKFDEPDYMESSNNYSKVLNHDDSPENLFNNLSLNPNIPDVFKGSPKRLTRPDDFDDAVPEFAATSRVFEIDFPNNVMKSNDRIPAYTIPAHFEVGSVFKLYVTEVHSPYKFWFQLADDDEEITSLMNSLDQKYTRTGDDFIIPVKCLKLGLVCAAKYEGDWHRAEIVGYVKGFKVKCYFVDFGTVADARVSDIKYLYKEFGMMPKQALRGSLACIQPLNDVRFTRAATVHFLSRVRGEKLHAQIREIDKNRVLHLVLCNTSGPNVIQLNHDLIEKHHARFDENWNASKRLVSSCK